MIGSVPKDALPPSICLSNEDECSAVPPRTLTGTDVYVLIGFGVLPMEEIDVRMLSEQTSIRVNAA